MTTESPLWRSIRELTIADQLSTLANREPVAGFAPWAELMSRNLSARDRASDRICADCPATASPDSDLCGPCEYRREREES